jgi:hypothetical protein
MYLIMNTAIAKSWGFPHDGDMGWCPCKFLYSLQYLGIVMKNKTATCSWMMALIMKMIVGFEKVVPLSISYV